MSFSGYNLYAIHQLSDGERDCLIDYLPKGLNYRLGGEEYEHHIYTDRDIYVIKDFIRRVDGSLSIVGDRVLYNRLEGSGSITHGNEYWFDIERWETIRTDLFNYLFRKERYYRNQSRLYVEGAEPGMVINVPLPQNNKMRWMLDELSKVWDGSVSIHIYGKPEPNYLTKLEGWVSTIKSKWSDVRVHELSGIDLKRYPEEKDTLLMEHLWDGIIDILDRYNIEERYLFTLVYNEKMGRWNNRPVYPRYYIEKIEDGYMVTDELENVL